MENKGWVLMTGASSGIGEAFARRFAREGWNLILVARTADKLEILREALERGNTVKTEVLALDLSEPSAPRKVYDEVKRKGISLEGLVNNAGFGVSGKFTESPLPRYLQMIDLHVRSLVELTGLFLPEMIRRRQGFILNVSSTAGFQPLSYSSVYAATKAFVTSFTEALWLETKGTGVRVLNLCPGLTKTGFGITAGTRDFRLDPWAEEPEAVVETAFRALQKKTPTAISGWHNRVLVLLERLVPHRMLLWFIYQIQNIRKRT